MKNYKQILEAINNGIKFALDNFEDQEDIQGQTNSKVNHGMNTKEYLDLITGIDLGLPSGTLWCKYNLGVNPNQLSKAEDWYGNYYAWGELYPKEKYNWKTYRWKYNSYNYGSYSYSSNYNKYKLTELTLEDDAAYQTDIIDNIKFKIPNKEQFDELLEYTTNNWVENYNDIKELNGTLFISKQNDNQLFIPANGLYDQYSNGLQFVGKYVNVWTSSLYTSDPSGNDAWFLQFANRDKTSMYKNTMYRTNRCRGLAIRPIILK